MAVAKILKTNAYYSRYQVKKRRRRNGKTDYARRIKLINQDKNKYNTNKYRLVVRFSNRDITAQVTYATVAGDIIICSAYAHELPGYGVKVGLTNYAAAYCVGLLCARRCLMKFGLEKAYVGKEEADGEDFNVEENEDGPRPFCCLLDVGLKRCSTGAKQFSVLKGALDGGLDIPHSEKRFVGYNASTKTLNSEMLEEYIYGGHVCDYMKALEEDDSASYQKQFSQYIKNGVKGDDLEDIYTAVHKAIRANPAKTAKPRKTPAQKQTFKQIRLTYDQKKANIAAKIAILREHAA